jgi:hypothetical protein
MLQEDPAEGTDRRDSRRVPYGALLGVAEYDGRSFPAASAFREVAAVNLSHSGMSFTTSEWPKTDALVMTFRKGPDPVYVVARIVGCVSRKSREGSRCYKVHCQFAEWLPGAMDKVEGFSDQGAVIGCAR